MGKVTDLKISNYDCSETLPQRRGHRPDWKKVENVGSIDCILRDEALKIFSNPQYLENVQTDCRQIFSDWVPS